MRDRLIVSSDQFENQFHDKIVDIIKTEAVNRGPAHAMNDDTTASTHELQYVRDVFDVPITEKLWQDMVQPNLPWAEDHFQERISGEPLNPAPSEAWWPFARQGNAEHKKNEKFSHTYPERFWPRMANLGGSTAEGRVVYVPHVGLRFEYGDFADLIELLGQNYRSRQAYLPIWFPEDLRAARRGERVPCSMGYHFIWNPHHDAMDCVYTMRSCDLVRFYRDDIYMAGRLLQHVCTWLQRTPGQLVVNIDNLHCFPGDLSLLKAMLPANMRPLDKRSGYNFEALG